MENKDNLVKTIESDENKTENDSKKLNEKNNSILVNVENVDKDSNYSNINDENTNVKEEKNDDLKKENIILMKIKNIKNNIKNWFLSKNLKFKLILLIASVILLTLLLTLIIVLSKKHSSKKKDSNNLILDDLNKKVDGDEKDLIGRNDELGYHILLHEVNEITSSVTLNQKALTNISLYSRKVKTFTDYMLINVKINIPLTGNNSAKQYSRILTYFDNQVIYDSTIYNTDTWELKPLTIDAYVKNVKKGEHTITIKAAVSGGTLHIPLFQVKTICETIKPRLHYSYFVAGLF